MSAPPERPRFWPLVPGGITSELLMPFRPVGFAALAQARALGFLRDDELRKVLAHGVSTEPAPDLQTFLRTALFVGRDRDITEELSRLAHLEGADPKPLWMILGRIVVETYEDSDEAVRALNDLYGWCDYPSELQPFTLYASANVAGTSTAAITIRRFKRLLARRLIDERLRREIAALASDMLAGTLDLLDGARAIEHRRVELRDGTYEPLLVIRAFADQSYDYPRGTNRALWAAEALERFDREFEEYFREARPQVLDACTSIVSDFVPPPSERDRRAYEALWDRLEADLLALAERVGLRDKTASWFDEYVEHREYGLALDELGVALFQADGSPEIDELYAFRAIAQAMQLDADAVIEEARSRSRLRD